MGKKQNVNLQTSSIEKLADAILQANKFFLSQAQKQVNIALTLRNWIIGYYIVEYEQHGQDRAGYGKRLYKIIAERLKSKGIKSLGERNLYSCKDFYLTYPRILQAASAKSYISNFQDSAILQTVSAKLESSQKEPVTYENDSNLLLSRLSFSHFIELVNTNTTLQRSFYEVQTIKNNWGVRELKRAMDSMLFERTGLSTDKREVMEKYSQETKLIPEDVFRNPYVLEFLGLEENPTYTETDLEEAIINHLQTFLLELGRGFCFEARQKRITFDNTHYRIDLVFYHRILKCSILIDLKIGTFSHADAGQMNVYLNYYKENETSKGDNPPIGIILCASKNEALVRYATMGLTQKVFVSKYLANLPTELELQQILKEEQERIKE